MNGNPADSGRTVGPDAAGRTADDGAPDLALMKQWALEQLPVPLGLCDRKAVLLSVHAAMTRVMGVPTAPHLRRARTFDEGGRGLLTVAQLTRRWGSRQPSTGKTIWAEIPLSRQPV